MDRPRLVVTVTASTTDELRRGRDAAAGIADIVELRLDGLATPDVDGALAGRRGPVIVTCRPTWEGGAFTGAEVDRIALLERAAQLGADYVDLEWKADAPALRARRRGLVLSSHDFGGVPTDLVDRYRDMRGSGADVVKIAVTAARLADCLPLLDLGRGEGGQGAAVLIAMGAPGLMTRIHPARFGSCWSYAGAGVAPGQLPPSRLVGEFRFRETTAATRVYGLVGRPVDHSLSPAIHNAAFRATGVDAVYVPLEAENERDLWEFAPAVGLAGASVTAPHKVAVIPGLDEVEPLVDAVGAVNTIKRDGGRWLGRNTDVAGFLEPLRARMALCGIRASVLGAGGAARAVAVALKGEGAAVTIHARREGRAAELARRVGVSVGPVSPGAGTWDLLVNATPAGTWPAVEASPVEAEQLAGGSAVYDLVYNPQETRLLRAARRAGCQTIGGLEMLLAQAERQFEWWTGMDAPRDVMRRAALARLGEMAGTR